MAFITLSGTLRDPTSELAVGDQIRFTHKSTTGETVEGAVSVITIDPSGTYSKDLQYGLVLVEYKDVRTSQFKNLGVATVNGSNPATSIPELLNALVPVSSAELIAFQTILADCVAAQVAAEASAAEAAQLGTNTGASLVGTTSGATVQQSLDTLTAGQTGGLIVFTTYALLDAYVPTTAQEEISSFKVTNDPTSSLNGYYHWVSGTAYTKDAELANGIVESGNVDATSGGTVFEAIDNTVKSDAQTTLDRFNIVSDSKLFNESEALIYAGTGYPKAQSTTYAGYATALTVSSFDSFDKVDLHIQLDAPTPCRLTVLNSLLVEVLTVDVDGVDGWNEVILPRLVGIADDSTLYIGIETVNRSPMTINTIAPPSTYAPTATYAVKGSRIDAPVGSFVTYVSSQYRIPLRLWNSHQLMIDQHHNVEQQVKRVAPIIAATLTTSMADNKGGSLLDVYSNYITTLVGYATAYLTPSTSFNAMRTAIRIENSTALRFYLKTETLDDIEFVDTDVLPAGDHFLSIALSKSYSSSELGTQFYVAVESIGHVSRVAPRNFTAVEANFPQPTNAFPTKSVAAAADVNTWVGGGSSTALRQYVEFFKLKNVSGALATAVSNAEAASITKLAIPSQIYAIDGLNNQNIYYSNITKSPSSDQYLFDIGAGLTGRMKAKSWQNRRTVAGVSTLNSKLYNRDRVLLDSKLSTVTTISQNAGTGKTPIALVVGDSITARGFYTQDLLDLASTDVMGLTLLGTQGTSPNTHEGYGGKTVDWFYTNEASPFVFNGIFDFSQYMSTNSYASVDYVIMHLGVNDIFPATDDTNAVSISDAAAIQIEAMLANFKVFNTSIKFGLMLPITPSFDQDAWGIVYSDAATYWRYNSSRGEWCNTMIANFDNRLGEDIYVLPTNCTIDIETAYDVADPIHPIDNGTGYQAMADTVWAFMKVKEL